MGLSWDGPGGGDAANASQPRPAPSLLATQEGPSGAPRLSLDLVLGQMDEKKQTVEPDVSSSSWLHGLHTSPVFMILFSVGRQWSRSDCHSRFAGGDIGDLLRVSERVRNWVWNRTQASFLHILCFSPLCALL